MRRLFNGMCGMSLLVAATAGCSGIDCPLNNTVYATWEFYNSAGTDAVTLQDTLYVKAYGTDSVLINRLYNASSIQLPMSYYNAADTLLFEIHTADGTTLTEQVIVDKTNQPHFNSPECGVWVEHTVTGIRTSGVVADSILVTNPLIDNNEQENFRICFK